MNVTWKRMYLGSYHGIDDDGRTVAQIGYVIGTDGQSKGWSVYLNRYEAERFDYYPNQEAAQEAAEAALNDS